MCEVCMYEVGDREEECDELMRKRSDDNERAEWDWEDGEMVRGDIEVMKVGQ